MRSRAVPLALRHGHESGDHEVTTEAGQESGVVGSLCHGQGTENALVQLATRVVDDAVCISGDAQKKHGSLPVVPSERVGPCWPFAKRRLGQRRHRVLTESLDEVRAVQSVFVMRRAVGETDELDVELTTVPGRQVNALEVGSKVIRLPAGNAYRTSLDQARSSTSTTTSS